MERVMMESDRLEAKGKKNRGIHNRKGITCKADGMIVLAGQNVNGMYLLKMVNNPPDTNITMLSLSKLTSLEKWH